MSKRDVKKRCQKEMSKRDVKKELLKRVTKKSCQKITLHFLTKRNLFRSKIMISIYKFIKNIRSL
jgi:hypothetical protein